VQTKYTAKTIDLFWSKVLKGNPDECWEWIGAKFPQGYGLMAIGGRPPKGKHIKAHRISYEINIGEIPDGMIICHKCDNPPCVNPNHLFLGTYQDNSDDKISKHRGKWLSGEDNASHKLTQSQVEEIRRLYIPRIVSTHKLAKQFGVDQQVIWSIVNYKTWK
jgi:hypothetical protein